MTYQDYLDKHKQQRTRAGHAIVTAIAAGAVLFCCAKSLWLLAPCCVLAAFAFNALQHVAWEGNRPAAAAGPSALLWSIVWDLRMTLDWWLAFFFPDLEGND